MPNTIKIVLADDQSLFREALKTLLLCQDDFLISGEAANGEEAVKLALQTNPDVILMDLQMPVLDGVTAIGRIKKILPTVNIIALTTFDDDDLIIEAFRGGAIGYLLKDVASERLFEAIRSAAKGEYFLSPAITAKLVSEVARIDRPSGKSKNELPNPLSRREVEILNCVAEGLSNKEIGEKLFISEGTVKNHLSNILAKVEARDRGHAVLKAKEQGWL